MGKICKETLFISSTTDLDKFRYSCSFPSLKQKLLNLTWSLLLQTWALAFLSKYTKWKILTLFPHLASSFKLLQQTGELREPLLDAYFKKKRFFFPPFFSHYEQTQSETKIKSPHVVLCTQVIKEKYQVKDNRDWCHLQWQTTEPDLGLCCGGACGPQTCMFGAAQQQTCRQAAVLTPEAHGHPRDLPVQIWLSSPLPQVREKQGAKFCRKRANWARQKNKPWRTEVR